MARVHFISTDLDLYTDEIDEFAKDIEKALAAVGCIGDRVIMLRFCEWQGSVKIDAQNAEEPF